CGRLAGVVPVAGTCAGDGVESGQGTGATTAGVVACRAWGRAGTGGGLGFVSSEPGQDTGAEVTVFTSADLPGLWACGAGHGGRTTDTCGMAADFCRGTAWKLMPARVPLLSGAGFVRRRGGTVSAASS